MNGRETVKRGRNNDHELFEWADRNRKKKEKSKAEKLAVEVGFQLVVTNPPHTYNKTGRVIGQ